MSQPVLMTVTGVVTSAPVVASPQAPSLSGTVGLGAQASYSMAKYAAPTINATLVSPFVVPFEGLTKVRMFVIVITNGGSFKLLLTSPNGGTDQIIPVSQEMLIHVPNPGDELTAIKLVGVGDVQYLLAGDVT